MFIFKKSIVDEDSNTIIVSFAGHGLKFGGVPRAEFANFLGTYFGHVDALFLVDTKLRCYHEGIGGISRNVDETAKYIKTVIEKYGHVVFLGVSAGGYAAILFGSLLNVNSVVAFIPQTRLKSHVFDCRYKDLNPFINDVTQYYLFGDLSVEDSRHMHHISHCEHLAHHQNVYLQKMNKVDLKELRDTGELFTIINNVISTQVARA